MKCLQAGIALCFLVQLHAVRLLERRCLIPYELNKLGNTAPWMASISDSHGIVCQGTLITSRKYLCLLADSVLVFAFHYYRLRPNCRSLRIKEEPVVSIRQTFPREKCKKNVYFYFSSRFVKLGIENGVFSSSQYPVDKIIPHLEYSEYDYANDIALLRLQNDVIFNGW